MTTATQTGALPMERTWSGLQIAIDRGFARVREEKKRGRYQVSFAGRDGLKVPLSFLKKVGLCFRLVRKEKRLPVPKGGGTERGSGVPRGEIPGHSAPLIVGRGVLRQSQRTL